MGRLYSLYGFEERTILALHGRHSALFPGLREADAGPLGSAASLLAKVLAETLAVVGVENSGDFGLYMWYSPQATPSVT